MSASSTLGFANSSDPDRILTENIQGQLGHDTALTLERFESRLNDLQNERMERREFALGIDDLQNFSHLSVAYVPYSSQQEIERQMIPSGVPSIPSLAPYDHSANIMSLSTEEREVNRLISPTESDEWRQRNYRTTIDPYYSTVFETMEEEVCQDERDCNICLEPMKDTLVKIHLCSIKFHKECLKIWIVDNKKKCPICRQL